MRIQHYRRFLKEYAKFSFSLVILLLFPILSYADTTGVALTDSSNGAFFTPSAADQSIMYLGELFGNVPPVLAGTGSGLMGVLFSSFNTAILSLGIFFAGYTTFVGILNTAGEGEMLGKGWNSIWVPVKTVAGIGLLIPTSSGYCICQIFMMWLLVQGIGAADTLTRELTDYLQSGQQVFVAGTTGGAEGESKTQTQYKDTPIKAIYAGLSCMQAYRKDNLSQDPPIVADVYTAPTIEENSNATQATYDFAACKNDPGAVANPDPSINKGCPDNSSYISCGKIILTAPENNNQSLDYLQQGFNAIIPSLNSTAYFMVNDPSTSQDTVMQNTFNFVGSDFLTQVENTYHSYVVQASNVFADNGEEGDSFYQDIASYGWTSLGNLYWDMAKSNGTNSPMLFNTSNKTVNEIAKATWSSSDTNISKIDSSGAYDYYSENAYKYAGPYGSYAKEQSGYSDQFIEDLAASQASDGSSGKAFTNAKSKDYTGMAASAWAALTMGVLDSMIDQFKHNQNPMISAQKMGHEIAVIVEYTVLGFMIASGALAAGIGVMSSMNSGFLVLQTMLAVLVPGLMLFAGVLLVLAGTLAVIIPFMPALAYSLAVMAWLLATLETIVAAPIVAVGIIHPDGQHPVWGKAEPAIMLIINMFLRPSLIVIGMSAGVILSFISIQIINFSFEAAMYRVLEHEPSSVEATLFLASYVALVLACVNKSFSAIDAIPEQVMRWISGGEGTKFGGGQEALQKVQGSQEGQASKSGEGEVRSAEQLGNAGEQAGNRGEKMNEKKENKEQQQKLLDGISKAGGANKDG